MKRFLLALLLAFFTWTIPVSHAQEPPIIITLDEAVQIALLQNLQMQNTRLDYETTRSQISEGYAELFPKLDLASSYTRDIISANPFAGSSVGSLFGSSGLVDWLAFNERSRSDEDPGTGPIALDEFLQRQSTGLKDAGIAPQGGGSNPFAVANQFRTGLTLTQKLFDARVIFGAKGAKKWLPPFTSAGILRQEQLLIDDVKKAFYQTRLVEERAKVQRSSVDRAEQTRKELARQVALGVQPKFQRLSAEVELANLETGLLQIENEVRAARDDIKLLLGLDTEREIVLSGSLEDGLDTDFTPVSVAEAVATALASRPDLEQARINVKLEQVQLTVLKTDYLPDLSAFLNLNYVGGVPDNRTITIPTEGDPFKFGSRTRGYFDPVYWNWDMNGGFRLSWNLFNGFETTEKVQQRAISIEKAELSHEFLLDSIRLEVGKALRDVATALERIQSQEKNVDNAALNYTYVDARLREGVASPIELREASDQLDQSRLNYLQAVHDYLVAISTYETSVGAPTNELIDPASGRDNN